MATPNKGLTFRALCKHYRIRNYIGTKLCNKINTALKNAQVRAGELTTASHYSDKP